MNRLSTSLIGLAFLAVLLLAVNAFAGVFLRGRIDLTEHKLYTLSSGTENILRGLEEPMTLRFFYSSHLETDVPGLKPYATRVRDLLEEYADSTDKIKLEVLDPEPYSEAEELAASFGLRGAPVNATGDMLYFGLAGTNSTDDEERIPFFRQDQEERLEYDLTQLVYKLSDPKKPVVGLLTTLPVMGGAMNPMNPMAQPAPGWFIAEQIGQVFDLRELGEPLEEVPDDVDILMVVHPQEFAQETLFAIDQFVLGGGRLMAFVDPHCEAQEVPQDPRNPMASMSANRSSDLGPLLAAWGVELAPGKLAADQTIAHRVNYKGRPMEYIVWLGLRDDNLKEGDLITADLKTINLATAGILSLRDDRTTEVQTLMETSSASMKIDRTTIAMGPDPERLLADFFPGDQQLALAVRISGRANTAFPSGAPKAPTLDDETDGETDEEGATVEEPDTALKESTGPINVILVADADMLQDRWWVQVGNFLGMRMANPHADNGPFVVNALDNLSGSNDLISLRSRGSYQRPFTKKDEIRRVAEQKFQRKADDLEAKLQETRKKLSELQGTGDGTSTILSSEQIAKIEEFRAEQVTTKRQLREVKHQLRKDIESLGKKLKFLNVFLIPGLIILIALGLWCLRTFVTKPSA